MIIVPHQNNNKYNNIGYKQNNWDEIIIISTKSYNDDDSDIEMLQNTNKPQIDHWRTQWT